MASTDRRTDNEVSFKGYVFPLRYGILNICEAGASPLAKAHPPPLRAPPPPIAPWPTPRTPRAANEMSVQNNPRFNFEIFGVFLRVWFNLIINLRVSSPARSRGCAGRGLFDYIEAF
ncbi:hypothetical protein EVAR_63999_1 [Eumeta japonica]|uniref:Uncharacterized protein n=1 Tax=Eumeta variegata TaxID=151549 RepID=A0A4C1Z2I1_EUMVA|nr:hypothetical protein EVAR_63999_1 [Eumeta japonica]